MGITFNKIKIVSRAKGLDNWVEATQILNTNDLK